MKIYIDTGIFIDYLAPRGHLGAFLRQGGRRGRTVQQLVQDATDCFHKLNSHEVMTSNLTLYEIERALYEELGRQSSGVPDRHRYQVISARAAGLQVLSMVEFQAIQMIPLDKSIFERALGILELQKRAVQAADTLHFTTAIVNNVEVIISSDKHILDLHEYLRMIMVSKSSVWTLRWL